MRLLLDTHALLWALATPEKLPATARRAIRADGVNAATPIIAITSFALSGDEQTATVAGATAYLAKPYSPRDLLGRIRQLLPES